MCLNYSSYLVVDHLMKPDSENRFLFPSDHTTGSQESHLFHTPHYISLRPDPISHKIQSMCHKLLLSGNHYNYYLTHVNTKHKNCYHELPDAIIESINLRNFLMYLDGTLYPWIYNIPPRKKDRSYAYYLGAGVILLCLLTYRCIVHCPSRS